MSTRARQGFTLLEVLIALMILAIATMGLMSATGQALRQHDGLERRIFAAWIAENAINELRARRAWGDSGTAREQVSMAGRRWTTLTTISPTANPLLRKVEVAVSEEGDNAALYTLTGFLGKY